VPESALVRASNLRFLTHAGPEIGVASTKAFTTQLAALVLLTMTFAKMRGRLPAAREAELLHSLRHLPRALERVLHVEPQVKMWSRKFAQLEHALFLGRGIHYPIAMEGALKLKEISYIHAEAYAAGELKHGPLALVDKNMPVIAIAPKDALLEKLKSNLQEVRARGGELHVLADQDTRMVAGEGIHVIRMPDHAGFLSPILHTVPLQLLAYHAALERGNDVDKPRNLAKSAGNPASPPVARAIYTCPMHPEIRQPGPGNCPKCGMALEPVAPSADGQPNPELLDMARRFWIGLALTVPVLGLAMAEHLPGLHVALPNPKFSGWIQFVLSVPVVLWAAWPFFVRGWNSLASRSLNMYTLIALGIGVAFAYSAVALLAPGLFPPAFRDSHGEVGLYFEAAA